MSALCFMVVLDALYLFFFFFLYNSEALWETEKTDTNEITNVEVHQSQRAHIIAFSSAQLLQKHMGA